MPSGFFFILLDYNFYEQVFIHPMHNHHQNRSQFVSLFSFSAFEELFLFVLSLNWRPSSFYNIKPAKLTSLFTSSQQVVFALLPPGLS